MTGGGHLSSLFEILGSIKANVNHSIEWSQDGILAAVDWLLRGHVKRMGDQHL